MSRSKPIDRKEQILDAAIQLFAKKGFHLTTMQEISEVAGISKGSVYLHFESKEQLIVSIYELYTDRIKLTLDQLDSDTSLRPYDRLYHQINNTFRQVSDYRHFIMMHVRESMAPLNDEMKLFLLESHNRILNWYRVQICKMYGADIDPVALDLATMLNAIVKEYLVYLLFNEAELKRVELMSSYIMNRLEDMAKGMLASQEQPIVTQHSFDLWANQLVNGFEYEGGFEYGLERLKDYTRKQAAGDEPWFRNEMGSTLRLLEKEWAKENRRPVMLKSLLSYLKGLAPDEVLPEIRRLEKIVNKL